MANSSSWPHPMNVLRALGHVFSPYGALAPVTREVSGALTGGPAPAPTPVNVPRAGRNRSGNESWGGSPMR